MSGTTASPPGTAHDVRLAPAAALAWAAAWWGTGRDAEQARAGALVLLLVGGSAAPLLLVRPVRPRAWRRRALRRRAIRPRTAGAAGTGGRAQVRSRLRAGAAVVLVACACAAAVLALTGWQLERRSPAVVTDLADRSGTAMVRLAVAGDPRTGSGAMAWQQEQVRVEVVLEAVPRTADGTAVEVRVPALLTGDRSWTAARWGERLHVPVAVAHAPPGAPYAVFLRVVGPATVVQEPRWMWRGAERLRQGLLVAAGADGSSDAAGLLPGLVVGDTSGQPDDLVADMRTAGLSHLTAVSGANVTIVCGGVVLLCVLLRVGHRSAAVLAGVALVALVVVARPEPSVLRAAVMGAVGLAGLVLGRRGGGLSALATAVVVVLLADPWLARAPGFRLSVLATGSLVVLGSVWARALGRVLPRAVALLVAVPAAAQAAVTPALVGLEPVVSLYALPANMAVAPLVAPATVIGLVVALVSLVHPGLAGLLAAPALWCAGWIALVARRTAHLPAASLPWPEGAVGVWSAVGATLVLVAAAALLLRMLPDRREPACAWAPWPSVRVRDRGGHGGHAPVVRSPVVRSPAVRSRAVLACAVVAVLAVVGGLALRDARGGWPGEDWAVVVCDVGQGESLLVRTGPGSAVVVDTGPEPDAVSGCLRRAGVSSVPLLVLTHLHADHVGGLTGVAQQAHVEQVWSAPSGMPPAAERDLQRWADAAGAELDRPAAGGSLLLAGTRVDVLAAGGRPVAGTPPVGDSQDVNDAGLVVRLESAGLVVLAVGDVGSQVQRRLVDEGVPLAADVTTVAHHGSADQLPAFYAAVGATLAVASAGRENTYGHPSPEALAVVEQAGTLVLSTTEHGDVALRRVGAGGGASPEASGEGPLHGGTASTGGGAAATGGGAGPAGGATSADGATVAVRTSRARPRRGPAVPA